MELLCQDADDNDDSTTDFLLSNPEWFCSAFACTPADPMDKFGHYQIDDDLLKAFWMQAEMELEKDQFIDSVGSLVDSINCPEKDELDEFECLKAFRGLLMLLQIEYLKDSAWTEVTFRIL